MARGVPHTMLLPAFLIIGLLSSCDSDNPTSSAPTSRCTKSASGRTDAHSPESVVSDWGQPVRLGSPINTPCPEDAIEISGDGATLFFLFTGDLLENMPAEEIFAPGNGTYRASRVGGPGEFGQPVFYDLGKGIDVSLDGEPSFSPDGRKVYFHSLRSTNTGYRHDPPTEDYQDIYVADITGGEPGPGTNLGPPVNSEYLDGEHAIHPDGVTLYFSSSRPGGMGAIDIWRSTWDGTSWTTPDNIGVPVNSSEDDLQPTFTADGGTMYFTSKRDPAVGLSIYRSFGTGSSWSEPELVIRGIVGEASLTADGEYLYFVHVLMDSANVRFDADVWMSTRLEAHRSNPR